MSAPFNSAQFLKIEKTVFNVLVILTETGKSFSPVVSNVKHYFVNQTAHI